MAPIRKLIVGGLTSAVIYAVRHVLGLDLGPDAVGDAIIPVLGFAAAYAVKDPRVKAVEELVVPVITDLVNDHPLVKDAEALAQRIESHSVTAQKTVSTAITAAAHVQAAVATAQAAINPAAPGPIDTQPGT